MGAPPRSTTSAVPRPTEQMVLSGKPTSGSPGGQEAGRYATVGVGTGVFVGVAVGVSVAVAVGVEVSVGVVVAVGVEVSVGVGVTVGVTPGGSVFVAVGVALGRATAKPTLPTLLPRIGSVTPTGFKTTLTISTWPADPELKVAMKFDVVCVPGANGPGITNRLVVGPGAPLIDNRSGMITSRSI